MQLMYCRGRSFTFGFRELYTYYTQFIMFKGVMCIHHQSMVCMICDSLHAAAVSVSVTGSVLVQSVTRHESVAVAQCMYQYSLSIDR